MVFNHGDMLRDFTYIDDIVSGVVKVLDKVPEGKKDWDSVSADPSCSSCAYRIYNIGNSEPEALLDFIRAIEDVVGQEAEKEYLPMQPGDVYQTNADTGALYEAVGFKPSKHIREGVREFVNWYRLYYKK